MLDSLPVKLALEAGCHVEHADPVGQDWMIGFNVTSIVANTLTE